MAIKTQLGATRYNNRLHKTFAPEILRLSKVESIARDILIAIKNQQTYFPYADECHLINIVQRIISEKTILRD